MVVRVGYPSGNLVESAVADVVLVLVLVAPILAQHHSINTSTLIPKVLIVLVVAR